MHQVSEQIKEKYYKKLQDLVNTWVQVQKTGSSSKSIDLKREIQKTNCLYHFWASIEKKMELK